MDDDFKKKVVISEPESTTVDIQVEDEEGENKKGSQIDIASSRVLGLLRQFLAVQKRRALAYTRLKRYFFPSFDFWELSCSIYGFRTCQFLDHV